MRFCTLSFNIKYSALCILFNLNRSSFNLLKRYYRMSSISNHVQPPSCVRGMKSLDKKQFDTPITIAELVISKSQTNAVMPYIKKYLFKMACLKPIQHIEDAKTKMLLNPNLVLTWNDFDETDRRALEIHNISGENLNTSNIVITYDNYNIKDVFKAVLDDELGFSSFSQIGHIIHLNLREHLLPYKNLIANILLDKVPNSRSVVNKVDIINKTYRNFEMELLCGSDNTFVSVKENYCTFEFDFAEVYWNPRLSTEHARIVSKMKSGEVFFDIFAGVGPFAIPAAKKNVVTFANDLNPNCFKWLNHNMKKNKVNEKYLKLFNEDGHNFIKKDFKTILKKYINKKNIHIAMNLPALAPEFLSNFLNLYDEDEISSVSVPPIVHLYCFSKGENVVEIAKNLVITSIGFDISNKIIEIVRVRTVSNFKEMVCVSFKLDEDILLFSQTLQRKRKCSKAMGKNKAKQMKTISKTIGSKGNKAKSKAKPVTKQLKKIITSNNKSKIIEIDKQLVELQDKVRYAQPKKCNIPSKDSKDTENINNKTKEFHELQEKSQATLEGLGQMEL